MTGDRTQQLIDAVSSPVRREILWLVWDRELTAGEIAGAFPLRAPTISSHLGVLRRAGLVTMTRQGTFRRYRARADEVQRLRSVLGDSGERWGPSGRSSEQRAPGTTVAATVVSTSAPCSRAEAFLAFTDPGVYSRWVGVPVTIDRGRFAMTMEWGLRVRGVYEHAVEPSLVVMRWDFERDEVPLPGDGRRAYLEIGAGPGDPQPGPSGEAPQEMTCVVEVTQLLRATDQADYMERAWGMILARFAAGVRAALAAAGP